MAGYKDDLEATLMMKMASVTRRWSTVFYGARENSCCPVHEMQCCVSNSFWDEARETDGIAGSCKGMASPKSEGLRTLSLRG